MHTWITATLIRGKTRNGINDSMRPAVEQKIINLASPERMLSEHEVSHLMTLCRKYLEHTRQEPERFPILKFFCDWSLHISIDRSLAGMEILRRLNDTLVEVAPIPDSDLIMNRLTAVVSFQRLRREMGDLFQRIGVANSLEKDQRRWMNFARQLIEIIRDCTLEVGDEGRMPRSFRKLYAAIKANPISVGRWVVGLSLMELDYGKFKDDGKNEICLHVLTSDTTHLIVPMAASAVFGPASI
jgi:hypothetical protein